MVSYCEQDSLDSIAGVDGVDFTVHSSSSVSRLDKAQDKNRIQTLNHLH